MQSLDGPFSARSAKVELARVEQVYVPPGCAHRLELHGQRLAVVFLAPGKSELGQFARHHDLDFRFLQPLSPNGALRAYVQACWDKKIDTADLRGELCTLLGAGAPSPLCQDSQLDALVHSMLGNPGSALGAQRRAEHLGLSMSRVRQRVKEELGISWRELRRWQRMRHLSASLARGESLTQAAQSLRFSDSAQLSRDFRASFGVAPSMVYGQCELLIHEELA